MTTRAGGTHPIALAAVEPGRSFRLDTSPVPLGRFAFQCECRGRAAPLAGDRVPADPAGWLLATARRRAIDHRRRQRRAEARAADLRALALTRNPAERRLLERRVRR